MNKLIAFAVVATFAFLGWVAYANSQTLPTPKGQEPMVCTSGLSKLQGQQVITSQISDPPVYTYKNAEARTFVQAVNMAYQVVTGKSPEGDDIEADHIDVYSQRGSYVVIAYFGGCTQAMARFSGEQMAIILKLKTAGNG